MKRLITLAMSICASCNFMITSMSVSNNHGPKPAAHLRLQEHRLKDIANWLEGAYCHATREYPDNTSLLIILKQLQEEYSGQGLNDFLKDHGQSKALINATKIVDAVNKDPRVILSKSLISKNPCIYKKTFQQILFDLITRTTELKFPLRECDTMIVYHDLPDDLLARNQHLTNPDTLVTYLVAKHLLEQDSDCEQLS